MVVYDFLKSCIQRCVTNGMIVKIVVFDFLVVELLKAKGITLRERVAAHRNHYYMKTKPPSSKKKDVVPIVDHALSKQKKKALAANGVSIVNAPKGASAKDKAKTSKKPSKKKPSDPVP